jgi:HK97 family phage prohead protease
MDNPTEQRICFPTDEHLRVIEPESEGQPTRIEGLAVPYGQLSDVLGDRRSKYQERILPGAFGESIRSGQDMRADVEHDPTTLLARSRKGTLAFREDPQGVWATITLPDTNLGRDVLENVRIGNLDAMSVAFSRSGVEATWLRGETVPVREVHRAELTGVTLTSYPAFPQTADTLVLRSLEESGLADDGESGGEGEGVKNPDPDPEEIGRQQRANMRRRLDLADAEL